MSKTYLVSRHQGAIKWLKQYYDMQDVTWVVHFDPFVVNPGDTVVGTLPLHISCVVCERGGSFLSLDMITPVNRRGTEYTCEEMEIWGAKLTEYQVLRVSNKLSPTGERLLS